MLDPLESSICEQFDHYYLSHVTPVRAIGCETEDRIVIAHELCGGCSGTGRNSFVVKGEAFFGSLATGNDEYALGAYADIKSGSVLVSH